MEAVLDDPAVEEGIVQSQDAALARLQARDFSGTLLRFVDEVIARPPRPAPAVAWDFWAQFEQFERFEELRQFRPALFQALPQLAAGGSRLEDGAHASAGTTPTHEQLAASREPRK